MMNSNNSKVSVLWWRLVVIDSDNSDNIVI